MANLSRLRNDISEKWNIKTNGGQAITGDKLKGAMLDVIDTLNEVKTDQDVFNQEKQVLSQGLENQGTQIQEQASKLSELENTINGGDAVVLTEADTDKFVVENSYYNATGGANASENARTYRFDNNGYKKIVVKVGASSNIARPSIHFYTRNTTTTPQNYFMPDTAAFPTIASAANEVEAVVPEGCVCIRITSFITSLPNATFEVYGKGGGGLANEVSGLKVGMGEVNGKVNALGNMVDNLDGKTEPIISAVEKLDWKIEKSYMFNGSTSEAVLNNPITLSKDGDSISFSAVTEAGFDTGAPDINGYGCFAHKNASNLWRGIGVAKDGVRIRFADGTWFNSSTTIKCDISEISISYENGNVVLRSNGETIYEMAGQKELVVSKIGISYNNFFWVGTLKDIKVNGNTFAIDDESAMTDIVIEQKQESSFLTEEEKKKLDANNAADMYVEKSATQMNIYFRKADGTYIGYPLLAMAASGMFYDYWATREVFVAQYENGRMKKGDNLLFTSEAELAMYIGLSDGSKNYVGGQKHGFENIVGSIQAGGDGSSREIVMVVDGKNIAERDTIELRPSNRVEVYQHTYLYPCSYTASPFAEVSKNWVFENGKMSVSTSIKMLSETTFYNIYFGMLGAYRHWIGDATKPYLTSRAVKCNKPFQIFKIEDGWWGKAMTDIDKDCTSILTYGDCGYSFKLSIEGSNLTNGGLMIRTNNNPYNKIYYGMESDSGLSYNGEWHATQIWSIN